MSVKLLTEHHLELLSLKGGLQAHLSLHLLKCHIVGNHMSRLIYFTDQTFALYSAVVITQILVSSHRGSITYAMHHPRETNYDKTKKRAQPELTSHGATVGPAKDKHQAPTNHRILKFGPYITYFKDIKVILGPNFKLL